MEIRMRQRIAEARSLVHMVFLFNDAFYCLGLKFIQPGEKRWADVEAHFSEIAKVCIGFVALMKDLFSPISIRRCAKFLGNLICEWVDTGRLIEMAVGAEIGFWHMVINSPEKFIDELYRKKNFG